MAAHLLLLTSLSCMVTMTTASAGALPAVGHLATARSTWHLSFPSFGFARLAEKKDQKAKTGLIDRNRSLHF
uniref:Uncharacterized protein n=1 Tax=Oryza barthii TaxID=65489 RepID=A0A0D3F393_9ORYZ